MGTSDRIKKNGEFYPTPFQITTLGAIFLFILLFFVSFKLSLIILLIYLFLLLSAPFIVSRGFFLSVISRGDKAKNAVSLTFDDGPDHEITPLVLELLKKHSVKACFFVTGKNVVNHPELIRMIIKDGHTIGNHSFSHDHVLMLRSRKILLAEIKSLQEGLAEFGVKPMLFRPPAGITNPMLRGVLSELGLICVNWSARAIDKGNKRINGLSRKILKKIKPGAIILLHDIKPAGETSRKLMNEFENLIEGIKKSNFIITPLSDLIGIGVMHEYPHNH